MRLLRHATQRLAEVWIGVVTGDVDGEAHDNMRRAHCNMQRNA